MARVKLSLCFVIVLGVAFHSIVLAIYIIYKDNHGPMFHFVFTPNVSFNNTRLLFIIISEPADHLVRIIIRETWAKTERLRKNEASRLFMLGLTSQPQLLEQLTREQEAFGDILLDDRLLDNYPNLPRKVVAALYWTSVQPWKKLCYVAKVDSDTFANAQILLRLADEVRNTSTSAWILGDKLQGVAPNRVKDDKWFVSKETFSKNRYPDYANGPLYMMSFPAVQKIASQRTLTEIRSGSSVTLEDVYLTGIIREKERVVLFDRRYDFLKNPPGDEFFEAWQWRNLLNNLAGVHPVDRHKKKFLQRMLDS